MSNQRLVEDITSETYRMMPFEIPDFKKRIRIWSELDKYKWKEDESVWKQKKGKAHEVYEVYFDSEFVCFFDLSMTTTQAVIAILEGMKKLFQEEKIFVNEGMYAVKQAQEEEKRRKQKEIELAKPTDEAEHILTEVVKRQAKKRGKKVVLKDKQKSL